MDKDNIFLMIIRKKTGICHHLKQKTTVYEINGNLKRVYLLLLRDLILYIYRYDESKELYRRNTISHGNKIIGLSIMYCLKEIF